MNPPSCSSCRFSRLGVPAATDPVRTEPIFCVRYPPTNGVDGQASFPRVLRTVWCGEYAPQGDENVR